MLKAKNKTTQGDHTEILRDSKTTSSPGQTPIEEGGVQGESRFDPDNKMKDDKKNKSKWRERKLLLTAAQLRHGQTAEKAVVIGSQENKKIQVYPPPRNPC